MQQSKDSNRDLILKWISRLSKHFGTEISEDQLDIFFHALRKCTAYQIDEAFERCLNECEFMPRLAQIHQRMPEQRYLSENPGRFILNDPPILDLVRPIAREICKEMTGREYDELDTVEDARLIVNVFFAANRLRYQRMGIDTSKWDGKSVDSFKNPAQGVAINKLTRVV